MEYIGTVEAGAQWGLTSARVRTLAREGKIEGAKLVGKSWMIPANAEKPVDGRSKQARNAPDPKAEGHPFKFPLFLLQQGSIEAHPERFTEEERALYQAQLLVAACKMKQALEPLSALARSCENPYVRAGALHDLCLCHLCLGNPAQFYYWVGELYAQVAQEERHVKEMELLLVELDSYYKGNDGFRNLPVFDLDEAYDNGVWSFLASSASYIAVLDCMSGRGVTSALSHELNCHTLERQGDYYTAMNIHFNLATLYLFGDDEERSSWHLRRAVEIGQQRNLLISLAIYVSYHGEIMDKVLSEFPDRFAMSVKGAGRKIHAGYQAIMRDMSEKPLYTQVSALDFDYITLAMKGLTNKEIAKQKGVSQVTVSKRFSAICAKLSLGSKKELVELARSSMEHYMS